MHVATDYRFFGIPQPVSLSENQVFDNSLLKEAEKLDFSRVEIWLD